MKYRLIILLFPLLLLGCATWRGIDPARICDYAVRTCNALDLIRAQLALNPDSLRYTPQQLLLLRSTLAQLDSLSHTHTGGPQRE